MFHELISYLESVPKAVTIASRRPFMNLYGFLRVMAKKIIGSTTRAWIINPTMTVTINIPKSFSSSNMSVMAANLAAIMLQIPIGEYLENTFF